MMGQKIITLMFLVIVVVSGCDHPVQKRQYTEIHIPSKRPVMRPFADPHAGLMDMDTEAMRAMVGSDLPATGENPYTWDLPVGWVQLAGDGMRLATMTHGIGEQRLEISVVSLGGMAGGLEANVSRWIRQLNIPQPSAAELAGFLDKQQRFKTQEGLDGILIDLSSLAVRAAQNQAMAACIITDKERTLFLKMTGQTDMVGRNTNKLQEICQSIRQK